MGLFQMFPICEAIINRVKTLYYVLCKYPIVKKIIPSVLVIGYHIQTIYECITDKVFKLYYTYVDTNYEE